MIQSIYWVIPFFLSLALVATGPLLMPQHWKKYHHVWLGGCIAAMVIPFAFYFGGHETAHHLLHTIINEYIPFIGLAGGLFTIASGIYVKIPGRSTPLKNVLILLLASLFSSLIGTLGASLVFIRPFLQYNAWRLHKTHLAIFFIFSVSNIAGVLTPLGDPPLFLGFLQGIDFFWTLTHLWPSFLIAMGVLLSIFYCMDHYLYRKETHKIGNVAAVFVFEGGKNLLLLGLLVGLIFLSNELSDTCLGNIMGVAIQRNDWLRNLGMVAFALVAFRITPAALLQQNRFSWAPLKEAAGLFVVIFITLIPLNIMLQQGELGPLASLFKLQGIQRQDPSAYFWACGLLSAVLDNAPTYMIFFKIAGGNPDALMTTYAPLLKAISVSAVFMGSLTYIGNAPNLIVKEIAQEYGVLMPSFLGYLKYSFFLLFLLALVYFWL